MIKDSCIQTQNLCEKKSSHHTEENKLAFIKPAFHANSVLGLWRSELNSSKAPPGGSFENAGESHLNSRTDRCERIHLREADWLPVHSLRRRDHDGGAGLALGPGGCGGVGGFGLIKGRQEHRTISRNLRLSSDSIETATLI